MTTTELRQQYVPAFPLDQLRDHPRNPRRGDDATVGRSISELGWYGAIIVQRSSNMILAGHTRRRALTEQGATTVPVVVLDVDDETALRILLADNRTAELASWDDSALLEVLRELASEEAELTGVGFTGDDLDTLQRRLDATNLGAADYEAEWAQAGMPGYESDDLKSAYQVNVHFRSDADADRFFALIDRPKSRVMWWPQHDGHVGRLSDHRVITDDDEPSSVDA